MCGLRLSCETQVRAGPLARDRGIVSSTTADSGANRDTLSGSAVLPWRTPFPIQIAPAPTARSVGVEPVPNVRTTARSFGSICETVLSSASSTQTLPSPTAMLVGAVPRGMVARSSPVLGSSTPALPPAIVSSLPCDCLAASIADQQDGDCTNGRREQEGAGEDEQSRAAPGGPRPQPPRRRRELRVLLQDLALEPLQALARLQPELLGEGQTELLVDV